MKNYVSLLMLLGFLAVFTLPLTGCGKKGSPKPPGPPSKVTYPRAYPEIE